MTQTYDIISSLICQCNDAMQMQMQFSNDMISFDNISNELNTLIDKEIDSIAKTHSIDLIDEISGAIDAISSNIIEISSIVDKMSIVTSKFDRLEKEYDSIVNSESGLNNLMKSYDNIVNLVKNSYDINSYVDDIGLVDLNDANNIKNRLKFDSIKNIANFTDYANYVSKTIAKEKTKAYTAMSSYIKFKPMTSNRLPIASNLNSYDIGNLYSISNSENYIFTDTGYRKFVTKFNDSDEIGKLNALTGKLSGICVSANILSESFNTLNTAYNDIAKQFTNELTLSTILRVDNASIDGKQYNKYILDFSNSCDIQRYYDSCILKDDNYENSEMEYTLTAVIDIQIAANIPYAEKELHIPIDQWCNACLSCANEEINLSSYMITNEDDTRYAAIKVVCIYGNCHVEHYYDYSIKNARKYIDNICMTIEPVDGNMDNFTLNIKPADNKTLGYSTI